MGENNIQMELIYINLNIEFQLLNNCWKLLEKSSFLLWQWFIKRIIYFENSLYKRENQTIRFLFRYKE